MLEQLEPPKPSWTITEISPTVHRLVFHNVKSGWTASLLFTTDDHWDNADCDLPLLKRDHDEAVRRNSPIFKFGDVLCLMQGKWDKRSDQNELREEHRGNKYFDLVANTGGKWYAPYSRHIALVTPGNHEGSVVERHNTDMTDRLLDRIEIESGHRPLKGGYTGFVLIGTEETPGHVAIGCVVHYHHGYGGGGEVTRGMIDNNRTRGQFLADVYVSGHIHRRNMDENVLISVTASGNIRKRSQFFLRCSSYKDETGHPEKLRSGGYHIKNGRAGRPKGGWWLNLSYVNHQLIYKPEMT